MSYVKVFETQPKGSGFESAMSTVYLWTFFGKFPSPLPAPSAHLSTSLNSRAFCSFYLLKIRQWNYGPTPSVAFQLKSTNVIMMLQFWLGTALIMHSFRGFTLKRKNVSMTLECSEACPGPRLASGPECHNQQCDWLVRESEGSLFMNPGHEINQGTEIQWEGLKLLFLKGNSLALSMIVVLRGSRPEPWKKEMDLHFCP